MLLKDIAIRNAKPKEKPYRMFDGGGLYLEVSPKQALYMAALNASRFDPNLKYFYQRLKKNGKKSRVALVATMRKIIVILNARIRDYMGTQTANLHYKTL